MKIERNGLAIEVSDELAIAIERAGRHPSRRLQFVLACQRCRVLCVLGVTDCTCCAAYGTKISGSATIRYPEDGKGHIAFMPIDEFSALVPA